MRKSIFCLLYLTVVYGDMSIRTADEDEFPFQVSIKDLQRNTYLCSGVLITRKAVLSLASCVTPNITIKVSAGSIHRSKQNNTVNYAGVIVHSKYNKTDAANNLAIIRISDPFPKSKFISPAKIPVQGTILEKKMILSGWNRLDPEDSLKVSENYTIWKDCRQRFNLSRDLGPNEFCGEFLYGPDPGSAVSKDGVVYGLQTEASTQSNMQTFVEISEHANWIRESLGKEASAVKWYEERNDAGSFSKCMSALFLFAIFLCQ